MDAATTFSLRFLFSFDLLIVFTFWKLVWPLIKYFSNLRVDFNQCPTRFNLTHQCITWCLVLNSKDHIKLDIKCYLVLAHAQTTENISNDTLYRPGPQNTDRNSLANISIAMQHMDCIRCSKKLVTL